MKYKIVKIEAGPASDALAEVASVLQTLTGLTVGEEAVLKNAPQDVKDKANELIEGTKELVGLINEQIGDKQKE